MDTHLNLTSFRQNSLAHARIDATVVTYYYCCHCKQENATCVTTFHCEFIQKCIFFIYDIIYDWKA